MPLNLMTIIAAFFLFLILPELGNTMSYTYSAQGSVVDRQQNALQISGWVNIDEQLRSWDGGGPGQPTTIANYIGSEQYQYYINEYSLKVGDYSLSGSGGNLYMPLFRYPTLNDYGLGDTMWFLHNATGNWSGWFGEIFSFYNKDRSLQNESQYVELAEVIRLTTLMLRQDDPYFPEVANLDLWLEREAPAPVPEPGTIILLGAGLLGMLGYGRRRKGECREL